MSRRVLAGLIESLDRGDRAVLVTIIAVEGSAPRRAGARMLIGDGFQDGSVGGGDTEEAALEAARQMLADPSSPSHLVLNHHTACGGMATMHLERFAPSNRLLVLGLGHIGRRVAIGAAELGWTVELWDPKADLERPIAPGVTLGTYDRPEHLSRLAPLDELEVVIATSNWDGDVGWAAAALEAGCPWVGVVGSGRKAEKISAVLEASTREQCMSRLRCPIGLDIGAEAPEEICIAILGELIARRHGKWPGQD